MPLTCDISDSARLCAVRKLAFFLCYLSKYNRNEKRWVKCSHERQQQIRRSLPSWIIDVFLLYAKLHPLSEILNKEYHINQLK